MADTLSITDNRTGKSYEVPIAEGAIRATDLKKITTGGDDPGLCTYDPAFMNTAACKSKITYIDGDKGILMYRGYPIEQLAESSTYLETAYLILFGELPTKPQLDDVDPLHHHAHHGAREHQEVHGGVHLRRAPDGRVHQHRRRDVDLLSGRQADLQCRIAAQADPPADRENADHRRLRLSPQHRPPLRLPRQRPQLHRQLPEHAVQDDRGEVPAEPEARARPRRAVHPARRSRAELLDQLDARDRQLARRSVLGAGRRRGRALRPAPRRRQRSGAAHAEGNRQRGAHPRLHQEGQGRRRPPDGLRPSRLQVVRPAGQDHQADRLRSVRGDGQEPAARHRARARTHRARGRILHQPQALSERRLLLGPHLPGDGLPGRDVRGAVRDRPHGGLGRAVGRDAARSRTRRSRARSSSTRGPTTRDYIPLAKR